MSKKKVLSIVIGLVAVLTAVSFITYAIATSGKGNEQQIVSEVTNYGAAGYSYTSNIDLIIQNSSDDKTFNVIEIMPQGQSASDLSKYIADGYFKQYVIDANSSDPENGQKMKADMIRYDAITVSPATDLTAEVTSNILGTSTLQELLDAADLIYVSSETYTSYNGDNNMSEPVYNFLHTYALGTNKPIIMDYVRKTDKSPTDKNKTYGDLVDLISNNHIRFRTFKWDAALSADDFFKSRGSSYLRYPVDKMGATGKILVICGTEANARMYKEILGYPNFRTQAYYGQAIPKADEIEYVVQGPGAVNAADLSSYDFILIEGDVKNSTIPDDVYSQLRILSESSKYILYDSSLVSSASSGGGTTSTNSYLQLMELLISNAGVAKYSRVLPVTNGFFTSLYNAAKDASMDAASKESGKAIADIIKAGDYRGSLMDGANGKKFRVLELQPCYPIDLEFAEKQSPMTDAKIYKQHKLPGNYYTDPGNVLMGKSVDEVEEGTEYYKFELSKAKLVKALEPLNLTYDQIELDQMSTEAFITDKNVVLETYDLVYIGGNTTALTPTLYSSPFDSPTAPSGYLAYMLTSLMPAYEMYTHNGIPSGYYAYRLGGYWLQPYGASYNNTIVQTNGNDLTLTKYNELKDYIDADMPILFSSAVSQAFEKAYVGKEDKRLEQMNNGQIDPDSRMFYVLKYAYEKKQANSKLETIVWNMDITDDIDQDNLEYYFNEDNKYGNTLGSYVHLFSAGVNQNIQTAVEEGEARPSFQIVSKPFDYIEGNASTYNKNEDGTMSITISLNAADIAGGCTATLYVDYDANGTFTEQEAVTDYTFASYEEGAQTTLTYTFPFDDFYGLVSWKIIVTATTSTGGTICDMRYGYAYFEREEDQDKKQVKVLQIMPADRAQSPGYTYAQNAKTSLYLCTECQQARYLATYDLTADGDSYSNITGLYEKSPPGVPMGLHEHKFGINKYDTASKVVSSANDKEGEGSEDWDYNFADEISSEYDFDIDILLLDDLEQYTKLVRKYYNIEKDEDGNTIEITSNEITEDPFDSTAVIPAGTLAEDYFAAKADEYKAKWEEAKDNPALATAEAALNKYLRETVIPKGTLYYSGGSYGDKEGVSAADIEKWIEHGAYYRYFLYAGNWWGSAEKEYQALYAAWVAQHDDVVRYHQLYNKYCCVMYSSDEWLLKNYDCVVIGFAEDFNDKDLTIDECNDIRTYLQGGGTVLLTHDCTTRYPNAGSINLTTQLRKVFGLDRYHVTQRDDGTYVEDSSEEPSATSLSGYSQDNSIALKVDGVFYGGVTVGKYNVTVDIVLDDTKLVTVRDSNNNSYTFYKPYRVTATDNNPVPVGQDYKITYNFYDSEDDLLKGNPKSSNLNNKGCELHYVATWPGFQYGGNGTIQNGTVTLTAGAVKSATITANTPLLYRKFALNGQTISTLPGSDIVDPTKTKYYFTELSLLGSDGESRVAFDYYVKKLAKSNSLDPRTIEPIGVTDSAILFHTVNMASTPYRYAEYNLVALAGWNQGATNRNAAGTKRASKVNDGIITVYPFKISDELRISATHAQQYALDLEDTNANAWFTLSGSSAENVTTNLGTVSVKEMSSMWAASPYDGMDSYFLYTYQYGQGTVVYTGAGNANVTGPNKNNNDERRLYLNVIVNTVRNKGGKPKITVHEKDKPNKELQPVKDGQSPNTNPFINGAGDYEYSVSSKDETPEFDYKVKINNQTKFRDIYVFYDLNYGADYGTGADFVKGDSSSQYSDNAAHVLIYHFGGTDAQFAEDSKAKKIAYQTDEEGNKSKNIIIGNLRKDLYGTGTADPLALKPSYFDPYGGTYTYIVIWAKDADGNVAYQRIKISLVPMLFDLTENTSVQPIYYLEEGTDVTDIIDKLKFDL